MHRIAIYDMDKTITRRATFGPFIAFVIKHYRPWRAVFLPLMALATIGYALKLIDRARLKEINLRLLLGSRIATREAQVIAQAFAGHMLATNTLSGALDRIDADRRAGCRIVLATASCQFYVDEIARLIGVTNVIATQCRPLDNAHFAPQIAGENCYGPAKLRMIEDWLSAQKIARNEAHIGFYSDHVSDAPCLEWADTAWATNPHAPLRKLAQERGWEIIDW